MTADRVFCGACGVHHDALTGLDADGFPVTEWLSPPDPHYAVGPVQKLVLEVAELFADLASRGHYDEAAEVADKALWMRDPENDEPAA